MQLASGVRLKKGGASTSLRILVRGVEDAFGVLDDALLTKLPDGLVEAVVVDAKDV